MNDERNGTHYAKLLHEKGFDNIYLVTGGIEGFLECHYELVEGNEMPEKPKPKQESKSSKKTTGAPSQRSMMSSTSMSKMTTFSKK